MYPATHEIERDALFKILNYDPETGIFTYKKGDMRGKKPTGEVGHIRANGELVIMINKKPFLARRLAWFFVHQEWPDFLQNINHDRQDNRISNIRKTSHIESNKNKKMNRTNTSGYTGVYYVKRIKRWKASIRVDGRLRHLGYFDDILDAKNERNKANEEYEFHENHGKIIPKQEM